MTLKASTATGGGALQSYRREGPRADQARTAVTSARLVFKHIRNTNNVGDAWCCPYDYLDFEDAVALDLGEPTPPCEAVIYGGGKIFGKLRRAMQPADRAARHRIAWGVGTRQSSPLSIWYYLSRRAMTLVGSRDWGDTRYDYAPCASCLSPLFDRDWPVRHKVVVYHHHWIAPRMGFEIPTGVPQFDNAAPGLEDAIAFLASGETVVTSSYHGVYWALLLGRKVLCVPFSHKFYGFRIAPGYATPKDWQARLPEARGSDEMLGLCREATGVFEAKVRNLIG